MRVIGGKYKGRVLAKFSGYDIRPTSDSARESLFNILREKIDGASFLDLFSGTGAVGIEAKSRGAKTVVLNDFSKESVKIAKKNIEIIGDKDITVYNYDAVSFVKTTSEKFDIIFIDAPYKSDAGKDALNLSSRLLKDGGLVVYENETPFMEFVDGLEITDERKYGRAYLTFFEKAKKGNCVFAGSFDPVTVGHEKVILSCAERYDKVFVVIGDNPDKTPYFTETEREELLKETFKDNKNITIELYSKHKDDYGKFLADNGIRYYVRGIRNNEDYIYEKKYEKENKRLYPFVKTVYIRGELKDISSTAIRKNLERGVVDTEFIPEKAKDLFYKTVKTKIKEK